jgi:hypothetical protein
VQVKDDFVSRGDVVVDRRDVSSVVGVVGRDDVVCCQEALPLAGVDELSPLPHQHWSNHFSIGIYPFGWSVSRALVAIILEIKIGSRIGCDSCQYLPTKVSILMCNLESLAEPET